MVRLIFGFYAGSDHRALSACWGHHLTASSNSQRMRTIEEFQPSSGTHGRQSADTNYKNISSIFSCGEWKIDPWGDGLFRPPH